MRHPNRALASLEFLLICPAILFLASLFVRGLQPSTHEPAHTAQRIVDWYAARPDIGLGLLLIALPLIAFVTGAAALLRRWTDDLALRMAARDVSGVIRTHMATVMIAASTIAAGGILAIVALHALSD